MYTNRPHDLKLKLQDIPESSSIRGIRYLTCQGGGMKGIGEAGAIERLEELGVIAQLEEVAGSSAGGIMATLIAIGCTAKEIKTEMMQLDFRALQDKESPGWLEAGGLKPLGVVEDVVGLAFGSKLGLWKGDALQALLANIITRKTGNPNITFAELAKLAEVPGSPFKKLTLTGSNITNYVLEHYNERNFPNMTILEAAVTSARYPLGFKPNIALDKKGKNVVRVDGGLMENLPDVFNKPPYITEQEYNKHGANKRAFALSFASTKSVKAKKIKHGFHLVNALLDAKMSEKALRSKYGKNIAKINTVGVGTLEFDASQEKKEALFDSGKHSIDNAFKIILNSEHQRELTRFKKMSWQELIRVEVALAEKLRNWNNQEQSTEKLETIRKYKDELIRLFSELEGRNIPEAKIFLQREREVARLAERNKLLDVHEMTDAELILMCTNKRAELQRIDRELKLQIKQLELAKSALEFNNLEILQVFDKNHRNNDFFKILQDLKQIEQEIHDALFERAMHPDDKNQVLQAKIKRLSSQRKLLFKTIISRYQDENNVLLANFFKDMLEDCNKPNFKIPHTLEHLQNYCKLDIDACKEYIEDAVNELDRVQNEMHLYNQYKAGFSNRTARSKKFQALLELNTELDKTLYRKTTTVSKINHFFLKKTPRLSKVIAPFLQVVAFLGFVCWLPVALPVTTIAKIIQVSHPNVKVRNTAERLIEFFAMTNLSRDRKLRGLKETTKNFIKAISDNKIESDITENSYLYRLYAFYLQNTGLNVKHIFSKKDNETTAEYRLRLEKAQRSLVKNPLEAVKTFPELISVENQAKALEHFRREVIVSVLESAQLQAQRLSAKAILSGREVEPTVNQQNQFRLIHAEYIANMDLKMQKKQAMNEAEVVEYLISLRSLNKPVPKAFREKHKEVVLRFERMESNLESKSHPATVREQELAKEVFFDTRQKRHIGKVNGKLEPEPRPVKKRKLNN